jgi:hypothetical protein
MYYKKERGEKGEEEKGYLAAEERAGERVRDESYIVRRWRVESEGEGDKGEE